MRPLPALLLLALLAALPARAGEATPPPPAAAPTAAAPHSADPSPAAGTGRVLEFFRRGGRIMWALLATSLVGLTFVLERLIGLRRSAHIPAGLVDEVEETLKTTGTQAARERLAKQPGALGTVLHGVLARRGATRSELERVVEDDAGRVLWDLRRNVRPVGIVASVAPLLGLLGTVIGMITAFQQAATKGLENPAHFAEGIYQALYTTAFGLTIAIPFLILYHYLRGKADVIMREVEDLAIRFVVESDPKRWGD